MNVGQKEMNCFEVIYGNKICSEVPLKKYFMTIKPSFASFSFAKILHIFTPCILEKKIIQFSQYNQCQSFTH